MNHLRISTRLALLVGALSALLIAIGGIGLYGIHRADDALHSVYEARLVPTGQIAEIQKLLLRNRLALALAIAGPTADRVARSTAEVEANIATITRVWETYTAMPASPEETRIAKAFADNRRNFVQQGLKLSIAALHAGDMREASRLVVDVVGPLYGPVGDSIEALMKFQLDAAGRDYADALQRYATIRAFAVASILAGVLLACLFGAALARGIARSLGHAVAISNAIAQGDLHQTVRIRGRDEVAQLLQALAAMQAQLARVVANVRDGSEHVATASAQIAAGNHDLSGRTEQQAGALEETASSMDALGLAVQQNAASARQANQLALNASTLAVQGGAVVAQVVGTMRDIHDSSDRIADITSVIDSIAFQTNILALNAAVEAARAGEQGRGFAVVASEVRSLAGRSAEAAREIKRLIQASVERVRLGTTLVDQAGTTMTEVVAAIQRVTDLMGEISDASSAQSQGVSQVGAAVAQMDQVTQDNAALVEEMAAAASSLKAQAQDLVATVAVFQLGGEGASTDASALAVPAQHQAWAAPAARRAAPAPGPRQARPLLSAGSPLRLS